MIQALRGMKDIIDPIDSKIYWKFIEKASQIAKNYGFSFVETPILEETNLFIRSVGESSDIVGKEMYRFEDKGGNDVCMRPEGTAGVVRAFIEKKLDRQGGNHKFFYYGPLFRYERPQKGRLRQFHQFGIESFGESSVYEDANIILLARDIFDALGIKYELQLNSLGCPTCMPTYKEKLVSFLEKHQDEICQDCKNRKETNPLRALDCKNPTCQEIYKDAPKIADNLCSSCDDDFEKLKTLLDKTNVTYIINKNLVRGLDYYNKTAFEFVSHEIGAQSSIAGGGRYDRLVEFLDGKPTPAIGIGIGIERVSYLISDDETKKSGIFFGAMEDGFLETLYTLASPLRKKHKVTFENSSRSLKALLKAADKSNAQYAVIVGESEFKEKKVWIKDLIHKKEEQIPQDSLEKYFD